MSTQTEVCALFAVLVLASGCSSATKLYKTVFHSSDSSGNSIQKSELCAHNKPSARHRGIALQIGADGGKLLYAAGTLPGLQVGTSSLLLEDNKIDGAKESGPLDNFNVHGNLLNAAKGVFADKQIYVFAGSPTPAKVLDKSQWLTFMGKGSVSLYPSGGKITEYSGVATLNIDPTTNQVSFSFAVDKNTAPFIHLNWTQIAYCDGFFQSTGIGRSRLTAPSGRLTNLVGSSNDGTSGTAVLSGLLYGEDSAGVAAVALAISGVSSTVYAVISIPRTSS